MKNKTIFMSFRNAFNGFKNALKNERNFKIHCFTAVLVLIVSFVFKIDFLSFIALILAVSLVLTAELINTAIEAMVDLHFGEEYSPYAKIAKDSAAAAVLASSIFASVIGLLVFGNKLLQILG